MSVDARVCSYVSVSVRVCTRVSVSVRVCSYVSKFHRDDFVNLTYFWCSHAITLSGLSYFIIVWEPTAISPLNVALLY